MTPGMPRRHAELSGEGLVALGARNACDREPIHLSGAIQPHGFLLAVDPDSLIVAAASANVSELMGGAREPLGLTLRALLGDEVTDAVLAMRPTGNPHDAVPVPVRPGGAMAPVQRAYHIVAHRRGALLMLEFEETLAGDRPQSGEYRRLRDAMKSLHILDEVEEICRLTVEDVRRLTGYDRVMIYRFEPDAHGHIVAEARREDAEPFVGLHYPASDIPRQARVLYLRNWIRVIADVDYVPVPILGLPDSVPIEQLDLSMSVLRSVSPVHLQYLRNMGVAATMTISLVVDNQLWGMIACHHNSPKRIDPVARLACETLGQIVSVRVRAAEAARAYDRPRDLGRMTAQVVTAMAAAENPALGAAQAHAALLGMTAADGVVVEIDGTRITAGTVPGRTVLDALVTRLSAMAGAGPAPVATDAVAELIGEPLGADGCDASAATGALFLSMTGRSPGFVLWLRGERAHTVRWAGPPGLKADDDRRPADAVVPLTPRASFQE